MSEETTQAVGAPLERQVRPRAWLRVSNISDQVTGVFEAGRDGAKPNVQLRTERLEPLFAIPPPKWWTCKTHGDAMPQNAWGCPECVREMRVELAALKVQLSPLLLLAQEVRLIDAHGATPDGDGVNGPTALWAEDWTRRLAVDAGPNARANARP